MFRFLADRAARLSARRIGHANAAADISATTIVQEGIESYREIYVLDRREFYRDRYQVQRFVSARAVGDRQLLALIPKTAMEVALVVGAAASGISSADPERGRCGRHARRLPCCRVACHAIATEDPRSAVHYPRSAATAELTYELADSIAATPESTTDTAAALVIRERIARRNPDFEPTVEVVGASVTYPVATRPAVRGISLSLAAGQSLALVGATGAGKSTLADIILGVLEPDEGIVLIGALPPAEAILTWTGGIANVPQQVSLSNGTVRQNVALGLPKAAIDDSRVWEALDRAHLAEFLKDNRDGLDAVVGERGVRLSGGQRQRLGVARALYTRPRLLVLDEATSALDAETEHAIASTLQSLEGEVTTVTVAHRLATIRHADVVMYFEKGNVRARGSFDEVRAQVPRFNHQAELLGL